MLQDYRTAVCPFIDVVDYNNMEYRAQDEGARGAFDWQLYYKRQVPCVRQERHLYTY
jgi:polypeptide N-acetylgalactosaminyltransferase